MKKTNFAKKILTVFALALLFACTLSTGTLAAGESDPSYLENKAGVANEVSERETKAEATEKNAATEEDANFFEKLYESVTDYISEILCVLAFGGSFLIAVLYKKGLLPLIKNALSAINAAVGRIKDATEKSAESDTEMTAKINNALNKAHTLIEAQSEALDAVEKKLDSLSTDKSEREKMKMILECEVELLYDIFMSSSLPEYQKDSVAKRLKTISSFVKEEKTEA